MKKISDICRVVLGLAFVFSGFVKSVDPWGTALKITEYLNVYGLGAEWLGEGRFALAIAFCAAELMMGLMLTFKVKPRLVSIFALLVMSLFLILTLLSATVLPVEDCGCFGDAIRMSPWASFGKNVVLWSLAFVVWHNARRRFSLFPVTSREWLRTILFAGVAVGLGVWCYRHLPLVDFLPYKVGTDLRHGVSEGDDIRLRQFVVFGPGGVVTDEILNDPGRVYLFCAARLEGLDEKCAEKLAILTRRADEQGARVVILTAGSIPDGVSGAYNMDSSTMTTMLRASVGVVTLDDGVIVDKRNCRDI